MDLSPLDYMLKEYPEVKERDEMRKIIGRYGITGKQQTTPIGNLSDGQRVSLFWKSRKFLKDSKVTSLENFDLKNDIISIKLLF